MINNDDNVMQILELLKQELNNRLGDIKCQIDENARILQSLKYLLQVKEEEKSDANNNEKKSLNNFKPGLTMLKKDIENKKNMVRRASLITTTNKSMRELIETGEILTEMLEIEKEIQRERRKKILNFIMR